MNSRMEYGARAELCRQLALREPVHGAIWLAEAERWLQLARSVPASVTALCGNLPLPSQLSSIADSEDRAKL